MLARKRAAGLAASTRRTIYTVVHVVLDCAVRDGLVARNAAAAVKRPTLDRREARYLSRGEVQRLLAAAAGDRLMSLFLLLLGTGLRRGEGLALRWGDVDLDGGHAQVRGTLSRVAAGLVITEPKTERSRRTVPLPASVVAALRRHRARQVQERLRAGTAWVDTGLVFTTELGTPLDPRNALRSLTGAARRAGLSGVGLHTLRHTAASALIGSDVTPAPGRRPSLSSGRARATPGGAGSSVRLRSSPFGGTQRHQRRRLRDATHLEDAVAFARDAELAAAMAE